MSQPKSLTYNALVCFPSDSEFVFSCQRKKKNRIKRIWENCIIKLNLILFDNVIKWNLYLLTLWQCTMIKYHHIFYSSCGGSGFLTFGSTKPARGPCISEPYTWPILVRFVSKYLSFSFVIGVNTGIRPTTANPYPFKPMNLAGLFVINRIVRTPMSLNICLHQMKVKLWEVTLETSLFLNSLKRIKEKQLDSSFTLQKDRVTYSLANIQLKVRV